jgi:imidazolonepropionase-like amidohydrolase
MLGLVLLHVERKLIMPAEGEVDPSGPPACPCCQPQLQFAARRISQEMSRRGFIAGVGASLATLGLARPTGAQAASSGPTPPIMFGNFQLFDGTSRTLRGGLRLLVEGNRIKLIATGELTPPDGARVIDCGGRVMMPGLIDAH